MDIGVSVGPYLDRIDSLPASFDFVEFGIGEGECPASDFDADAVSTDLASRSFGAAVHLPYRQPLSTPVDRIDDATATYLTELLSTAAGGGAETAVAHPSGRGAGSASAALADRMAALAAAGRSHDVTVCFETTGYAGGPSLDRVGDLAARADAAVCLDVGYAFLEAGADGIADFLGSYADLVTHLHVHDTRRRGDTHIPVGSGDVPYGRLGPALADAAPDATATIEVFTDDAGHLTASADRFAAAVAGDDSDGADD